MKKIILFLLLTQTGPWCRASQCPEICDGAKYEVSVGDPLIFDAMGGPTQADDVSHRNWSVRGAEPKLIPLKRLHSPLGSHYLFFDSARLKAPGEYELLIDGQPACTLLHCCGMGAYRIGVKDHAANQWLDAKRNIGNWRIDSVYIAVDHSRIIIFPPEGVARPGERLVAEVRRLSEGGQSASSFHFTEITADGKPGAVLNIEASACENLSARVEYSGEYTLILHTLKRKKLFALAGWRFKVPSLAGFTPEEIATVQSLESLVSEYQHHPENQAIVKRYQESMDASKPLFERYSAAIRVASIFPASRLSISPVK